MVLRAGQCAFSFDSVGVLLSTMLRTGLVRSRITGPLASYSATSAATSAATGSRSFETALTSPRSSRKICHAEGFVTANAFL